MLLNLNNAAYQKQGKQEGINQTKVGTASTGDVLAGKTFTNSSTVGATGTMPNHGVLNWKPTWNTTQNVQPGYYSGGTLDSTGAYNKGMEDADARVNEDSESYKEGFINGKTVFAANILLQEHNTKEDSLTFTVPTDVTTGLMICILSSGNTFKGMPNISGDGIGSISLLYENNTTGGAGVRTGISILKCSFNPGDTVTVTGEGLYAASTSISVFIVN